MEEEKEALTGAELQGRAGDDDAAGGRKWITFSRGHDATQRHCQTRPGILLAFRVSK